MFSNLQDKDFCNKTFGLYPRYSIVNKLSNIVGSGLDIRLEKRYYQKDYYINNEIYRVCSQIGGSTRINGVSMSTFFGEQLILFLQEKNILDNKYKNEELCFDKNKVI